MTRSLPPVPLDSDRRGPVGLVLRSPGLAITTGLAIVAGLALTGCTPDSGPPDRPVSGLRLAAFSSCANAVAEIRASAKNVVGPYGFFTVASSSTGLAVPGAAGAAAAPAAPAAGADRSANAPAPVPNQDYSTTNTAEQGVDEPDLVKTDGHRIVTITGGVLRVIDAGSKAITGQLDLTSFGGGYAANLLLSGDHALVLLPQNAVPYPGPPIAVPGGGVAVPAVPNLTTGAPVQPAAPITAKPVAPPPVAAYPELATITGPHLLLVDLVGDPQVLASYAIDGSLVDARQVGSTARVVVQSSPRIAFPVPAGIATEAQRVLANRNVIDAAPIDQWLPRFASVAGAAVGTGHVGCAQVYRPASYTGTNVLTVLTFDLSGATLGSGQPVSIEADGTTVYATPSSLYVASDQRWRVIPGVVLPKAAAQPYTPLTSIYRFDTGGTLPRFTGSGAVPGYLLNQYSMSDWGGKLRVATTSAGPWLPAPDAPGGSQLPPTSSAVYVLDTAGSTLDQVGTVGGLGRGERIYAVRFEGPVGYVVTYYQTDPLYTLDLSNPTHPAVRGVLKLSGYSAYLHPASSGRLIGIGQDAGITGIVRGTQVSLFDVSNLAAPSRLAHYVSSGSHSQAEFDPHAFLYWPDTNLLVVPLQTGYGIAPVPGATGGSSGGSGGGTTGAGGAPAIAPYATSVGALVLRVTSSTITERGFLVQPGPGGYYPATIERSLVIGSTLWTVSETGMMATDISSLQTLAFIAFA